MVRLCRNAQNNAISAIDSCKGTKGAEAAKQIGKYLDKIPHDKYVEPFAGHGNTFFAKSPSKKEYLNDIDCKQLKYIKLKACSLKNKEKCERLKKAVVTCGKDWKTFVRHDSKNTLFYLDPPYEKTKTHLRHTDVPFKQVIEKAKSLEGKVAVSYVNKPEFRKELCKKPFKCHEIRKHMLSHRYTELLAIKK